MDVDIDLRPAIGPTIIQPNLIKISRDSHMTVLHRTIVKGPALVELYEGYITCLGSRTLPISQPSAISIARLPFSNA